MLSIIAFKAETNIFFPLLTGDASVFERFAFSFIVVFDFFLLRAILLFFLTMVVSCCFVAVVALFLSLAFKIERLSNQQRTTNYSNFECVWCDDCPNSLNRGSCPC